MPAWERAAGSLGDLPLVVLTTGNRGQPTDLPAGLVIAYEKMFGKLQVDLAKLSTRGRQIIAKPSEHFIHQDEPELVVAVIREMVEQARQGAIHSLFLSGALSFPSWHSFLCSSGS